jgi:drug/metabolite transporter (DMT)-like permease
VLKKHRAELFLLLGAITFSFNGVVAKIVLKNGLDSWHMVQIRCTGALLIILAYVLVKFPNAIKVKKSELPMLFAFGLFGVAAVQFFYFISIRLLDVSIALLIEFTSPIWIVLWMRFVKKKHISPLMWWGLGIGFGGMILLAQVWKGLTLNGWGVISAIFDAFALASYFLLGEKIGKVKSSEVMMVWGFGITAAIFAVIKPWWSFPYSIFSKKMELASDGVGPFAGHYSYGWVLILWVVIMGTVVPYFCVITGLKGLNASTASVIGMLEPVLAGVFAWICLSEKLSTAQLAGGAVVLVGIYLADKAKNSI